MTANRDLGRLPELLVAELVRTALLEDVGSGDVTSLATIPAEARSQARMVAREPMVVCGLALACAAFRQCDPSLFVDFKCQDGQKVERGEVLLEVEGSTRAILSGERVALNFLQRLSGVATMTAKYVQALEGTSAQLLDTRKTTPGWRILEKFAVRCGGGKNHRHGLYDMVLVKDNHLAALAAEQPNAVTAAVRRARAAYPHLRVEIEADTLEQARQAAEAGADIVLLDNMSLEQLRMAVASFKGRVQLEASGGVTLDTIHAIGQTGVDFISVGAITHSARAVDIGLDFVEPTEGLQA